MSRRIASRGSGTWLSGRCGLVGRIFFIDSYQSERAETADQRETLLSQRELNDGRQFEIIKIFYQPAELQQRLHALGWHVTVDRTAQHFLYGAGHR